MRILLVSQMYPGPRDPDLGVFVAQVERELRSLVAACPAGDFSLGGFCTGAVIALELACRLAQAGRPAQTLVLVDPIGLSRGPDDSRPIQEWPRHRARWLARRLLLRAQRRGHLIPTVRYGRAAEAARWVYRPRVYPGEVVVVDTVDHRAAPVWSEIAASLERRHLAETHGTLFRRGSVEVLGETLRRVLSNQLDADRVRRE